MKFVQVATMAAFLVAGGPFSASAQPAAGVPAGGDFAQHKQRELARIAERIQALQALQGCVQAAADAAALQACNDNARASMRGRGR
jgi:hypothetical protein